MGQNTNYIRSPIFYIFLVFSPKIKKKSVFFVCVRLPFVSLYPFAQHSYLPLSAFVVVRRCLANPFYLIRSKDKLLLFLLAIINSEYSEQHSALNFIIYAFISTQSLTVNQLQAGI